MLSISVCTASRRASRSALVGLSLSVGSALRAAARLARVLSVPLRIKDFAAALLEDVYAALLVALQVSL